MRSNAQCPFGGYSCFLPLLRRPAPRSSKWPSTFWAFPSNVLQNAAWSTSRRRKSKPSFGHLTAPLGTDDAITFCWQPCSTQVAGSKKLSIFEFATLRWLHLFNSDFSVRVGRGNASALFGRANGSVVARLCKGATVGPPVRHSRLPQPSPAAFNAVRRPLYPGQASRPRAPPSAQPRKEEASSSQHPPQQRRSPSQVGRRSFHYQSVARTCQPKYHQPLCDCRFGNEAAGDRTRPSSSTQGCDCMAEEPHDFGVAGSAIRQLEMWSCFRC